MAKYTTNIIVGNVIQEVKHMSLIRKISKIILRTYLKIRSRTTYGLGFLVFDLSKKVFTPTLPTLENPYIRLTLRFPIVSLKTRLSDNAFFNDEYITSEISLPTTWCVTRNEGFFSLTVSVLGFGLSYSRQTDY